MKSLRLLLVLLLTFGASGLRGQSIREEVLADPAKAGGVYYVYTYDNPVSTLAPKGYEPFYISHFGRHGSRWMLHNSDYTELKAIFDAASAAEGLTDYGKDVRNRIERIYADGINRAGDLAPLGAVQHRQIAERMYKTYPEVFRNSTCIDARSTVVVRCVLSMAAFCERLKELNPALQITRSADLRNTRIFNFYSTQANPDISQEYLDLPKSPAWKAEAQQFRDARLHPERLMEQLFNKTYAATLRNPPHLMQLLGSTRASLQGLEAGVSLDDLFTPDELYALWECDNYGFYRHRGPSPENDHYPERLAKVFLEDVLTRADKAIAAGIPTADLRFGHDGNLMAILNLLRFEGCATVTTDSDRIADVWQSYRVSPMAANIQFIFFRNKNSDDVLVKILHNEREVRIPLESDLAPYYRWEAVRKFYREVLDSIPSPEKIN